MSTPVDLYFFACSVAFLFRRGKVGFPISPQCAFGAGHHLGDIRFISFFRGLDDPDHDNQAVCFGHFKNPLRGFSEQPCGANPLWFS